MFSRILIANRGEVALRVIRACRELGVRTVAVYSEADRDSLHVQYADDAVCIGPGPSSDSYLNIPNIIATAEITDVEAIHPGYGFLAENPHFAEICESCRIKFIGPSSEVIRQMGDKSEALKTMKKAGLPIIPGSEGAVENKDQALELAREIGYPVIIKAVAGGGGRGMRVAHNDVTLAKQLGLARQEAEAGFGNPAVYLEKFIERSRHIEVQILADEHGNIVHLGERECSIQRKHQKLVEESPSTAVTRRMRERIGRLAVEGAKAVKYQNAGTVEFLFDPKGNYYFIEMNTRIQVEHPVTELVTGIDLVKEQIRIAAGDPLGYSQRDIGIRGHAIECRINAEDPSRNFLPCPGEITAYNVPGGPGVRVDSHVYADYRIPPYYDSMIAKLITYGEDRKTAISRMARALEEYVIEGVYTTIPLHERIIDDGRFRRGKINTAFLEDVLD